MLGLSTADAGPVTPALLRYVFVHVDDADDQRLDSAMALSVLFRAAPRIRRALIYFHGGNVTLRHAPGLLAFLSEPWGIGDTIVPRQVVAPLRRKKDSPLEPGDVGGLAGSCNTAVGKQQHLTRPRGRIKFDPCIAPAPAAAHYDLVDGISYWIGVLARSALPRHLVIR